jgi:hypothetical protein
MLLTVAGQSPIFTAFPILPACEILLQAGHLCCDEYIKNPAEMQ